MNKIVVSGSLSSGKDEIDLDLVRRMTIHPVYEQDEMIGSDKQCLSGLEVQQIEWRDKTKKPERTCTIYGDPQATIDALRAYEKDHPTDFWHPEIGFSLEIQPLSDGQMAVEYIKQGHETAQEAKKELAETKVELETTKTELSETKIELSKKKSEKAYIIETLIIAALSFVVGGLFFGGHPYAIVGLAGIPLVLFWGRIWRSLRSK